MKQQPIRARMCGFGDKVRKDPWDEGISACCFVRLAIIHSLFLGKKERKKGRSPANLCADGYPQDRRPITPPPCVRLVVKDEATGKEVDIK